MSDHALGDAPIQNEAHQLAAFVDRYLNGENAQPHVLMKEDKREWGFVLLVFPFGEEAKGRCNFISNGSNRENVVALFKEMITRFEGQPEIVGHA